MLTYIGKHSHHGKRFFPRKVWPSRGHVTNNPSKLEGLFLWVLYASTPCDAKYVGKVASPFPSPIWSHLHKTSTGMPWKSRRRRVKRHNQFWPLFLLYALLLTPCHQRKRPPHLRKFCHSSLSFALFILQAICLAKNGKHISHWKVEDTYVFFPFSFETAE